MDREDRSATGTQTAWCMGRKVFVDTSGWYALIDRNDAWHNAARLAVRRILDQRETLVTSDYVVDESCTLARVRAGAAAAVRLLDLLHQTQSVEWEWIGADRFSRAEALFRKHRDQEYSFTDCSSFVLMRELRLEAALTSDAHFRTAGFRPLLTGSAAR